MERLTILRIALLLIGAALVAVEVVQSRRQGKLIRIAQIALAGLAGANISFIVFLWFNHISFPLNLDLMESTVLQHFQRAASFQPIYPEPTPAFIAFSYNPLYYEFAIPFGWVFGVNLFTLRLVAILGTLGSGVILFKVVQQKTASTWWGLLAVGLFAAAYHVMDTYLDNAHSDSWLLCTALLGSYVIDQNRSRLWNLVGVLILVASFWFKQHGALFAIGGVLFLTWRAGLKSSWPYWLASAIFGPIFYIFLGPSIFGPYFHYFTWEVPRQWSELNFDTFQRYLGFILKSYPLVALSGTLLVVWNGLRDRERFDVWHFQFVFAALAGFMGALDPGSADNVFIPMGVWFILLGTLGLHQLAAQAGILQRYKVHLLVLFATLAILLYNPLSVVVSPEAGSYADLIALLKSLPGNVYTPSLGQLPDGYTSYPAAHWVALDDMTRGPGRDNRDHPVIRQLLDPAIHPNGPAFILANYPLEVYPWLAFLEKYYTLESDFGDRFESLRVLPKRFDHGWPRYLYRYNPH